MESKIRFKDLSFVLKVAIVGGFMTAVYTAIIIISFVLGIIMGTIAESI